MDALHGISARFAAGTSTLVLGSPGSGKTTLLRAVAGRLDGAGGTSAAAAVRYNGVPIPAVASERGLQPRRLAAYAPQVDQHQAFLTVRELLSFAHASCASALPTGASEVAVRERSTRVDRVISLLGLDVCANTIIGSAVVRGISGGQKRRVSVGEMMLSGARVLACDQITDGLDSAVALDIMRFLAAWARATGGTVVAALQAPTPEVLGCFDSVLLLGAGRVLYAGQASGLEPYLRAVGFPQPALADIADHAVQVATSPATTLEQNAKEAESGDGAAAGAPAATTVAGLAETWAKKAAAADAETAAAAALKDAAALTATASAAVAAQYGSYYAHSIAEHTRLLFAREGKLYIRNMQLIMAKIMQSIVLSLIFGGIFFQKTGVSNFFLQVSIMFFALVFIAYSGLAEVPVTANNKHVVKRHLAAQMYPAWSYSIALILVQLPVLIVGDLIFAAILYFMVGL